MKSDIPTISPLLERAILEIATRNGLSHTPSNGKSAGRHQVELSKGRTTETKAVYVDRIRGVAKSNLRAVIDPNISQAHKDSLLSHPCVKPARNSRTGESIFQSSNFRLFRNRNSEGYNQHFGFGLDIDISKDLDGWEHITRRI